MKIALLNLPVDNNYGGMLQRYALMKVLEDMGHEVIHLNMRFPINAGSMYSHIIRDTKRLIKRYLGKYSGPIRVEHKDQLAYELSCAKTDKFYNKYVKHTKVITDKNSLRIACASADVLLIGSDQVWRKPYCTQYGIATYFGDFLPDNSPIRKIAYGVSFGVAEDELNDQDKLVLGPLYKSFHTVSVREDSALILLKNNGWTSPAATMVLDPTLLLSKDDYSQLINRADTASLDGNMCCYILDPTKEKTDVINKIAEERSLSPFYLTINGKYSVEQWLRSFRDSDFVVTDSYHGAVFSIIMQKPFFLFRNKNRGSARFDSLLNLLKIEDTEAIDWSQVNSELEKQRCLSLSYLKKSVD